MIPSHSSLPFPLFFSPPGHLPPNVPRCSMSSARHHQGITTSSLHHNQLTTSSSRHHHVITQSSLLADNRTQPALCLLPPLPPRPSSQPSPEVTIFPPPPSDRVLEIHATLIHRATGSEVADGLRGHVRPVVGSSRDGGGGRSALFPDLVITHQPSSAAVKKKVCTVEQHRKASNTWAPTDSNTQLVLPFRPSSSHPHPSLIPLPASSRKVRVRHGSPTR